MSTIPENARDVDDVAGVVNTFRRVGTTEVAVTVLAFVTYPLVTLVSASLCESSEANPTVLTLPPEDFDDDTRDAFERQRW